MKYYILEKNGTHKHTTSLNVVQKYRKEGYVLVGYMRGIDIKIRWVR